MELTIYTNVEYDYDEKPWPWTDMYINNIDELAHNVSDVSEETGIDEDDLLLDLSIDDYEFKGKQLSDFDEMLLAEEYNSLDEYLAFCDHVGGCGYAYYQESYQGCYRSGEEFAEQYYCDLYEIPEHLISYIDWGRVWKDLSMDHFEIHGNYYRNM